MASTFPLLRIAATAAILGSALVFVISQIVPRLWVSPQVRQSAAIETLWRTRPEFIASLRAQDAARAITVCQRWIASGQQLQHAQQSMANPNGSRFAQQLPAFIAAAQKYCDVAKTEQWELAANLGYQCLVLQRDLANAWTNSSTPTPTSAAVHNSSLKSHASHRHALYELPTEEPQPSLTISVTADPKSGWNVHCETQAFEFAPHEASGPHVPGHGHAHLYVDDQKIARLYSEWYHLALLSPGQHTVRVTLNTNDHRELAVLGQTIEATTTVTVTDWGAAALLGPLANANSLPSPVTPREDELCRP